MVNVYLIVEDKYINEMLGVTTIEIKSTVLCPPRSARRSGGRTLSAGTPPYSRQPSIAALERKENVVLVLWKTFISNLRRTKTGQS